MQSSRLPSFRLSWREVSGALGDLGALLPLAVALITVNGLPATSVFFGIGAAHVLTGLTYRLPVPVQPIKAVAAIAIAQGLSGSVVVAAGWWMGLLLLVLSATGAAQWLGRLFTRRIIRGIQLVLGLLLVRSGFLLASRLQIVPGGSDQVIHLASRPMPLGWFVGGAAALVLAWAARHRRWPTSLIVLCFGALVAFTAGGIGGSLGQVRLGLSLPRPLVPRCPTW